MLITRCCPNSVPNLFDEKAFEAEEQAIWNAERDCLLLLLEARKSANELGQ